MANTVSREKGELKEGMEYHFKEEDQKNITTRRNKKCKFGAKK